jgi:hypothetical protein
MIRSFFLLLLCVAVFVACQNRTKEIQSTPPVQGRYGAICLDEGVMDTAKADTSLTITVDKDSIAFSRQRIANCCGWFDSLGLRLDNDTLRLVDKDKDKIRSACDCNCLFQEAITLHRFYYDSIQVVDFGGRLIYKHETEMK